MKVIILIFAITCLMVGVSEASWYVVDADNKVIVKCEYEPDAKDLKSRNEIAVFSEEEIPLREAEYVKGKITRHIKTSSEIALQNKRKKKETERVLKNKKETMTNEKLKNEDTTLNSQENK